MNAWHRVWSFTRRRLDEALAGLSDSQALWRGWSEGHNIFEYALHVAGAEAYWASRLRAESPSNALAELERCVHEGFLRDGDFPVPAERQCASLALESLALSRDWLEPVIASPTSEQLAMSIVSPIGDSVDGAEGLTRLAQHAGYHTGQINLLRQMPGFPG